MHEKIIDVSMRVDYFRKTFIPKYTAVVHKIYNTCLKLELHNKKFAKKCPKCIVIGVGTLNNKSSEHFLDSYLPTSNILGVVSYVWEKVHGISLKQNIIL